MNLHFADTVSEYARTLAIETAKAIKEYDSCGYPAYIQAINPRPEFVFPKDECSRFIGNLLGKSSESHAAYLDMMHQEYQVIIALHVCKHDFDDMPYLHVLDRERAISRLSVAVSIAVSPEGAVSVDMQVVPSGSTADAGELAGDITRDSVEDSRYGTNRNLIDEFNDAFYVSDDAFYMSDDEIGDIVLPPEVQWL